MKWSSVRTPIVTSCRPDAWRHATDQSQIIGNVEVSVVAGPTLAPDARGPRTLGRKSLPLVVQPNRDRLES